MLLVSIHDVAQRNLQQVQRIRDCLSAAGAARVTLLAIPHYHAREDLASSPQTLAWLRQQIALGDEVALHGRYHLQRAPIASKRDRLRARLFTANEGECLCLTPEALRDMMDGKARLEESLGSSVHGFVAPAWLEPRAFVEPLRAAGFRWHEVSWYVERIGETQTADVKLWSPVLGFATRTTARRMGSLLWTRALTPVLQRARNPVVRVALHPSDWDSPTVVKAATQTVAKLAARYPNRVCGDVFDSFEARPQ